MSGVIKYSFLLLVLFYPVYSQNSIIPNDNHTTDLNADNNISTASLNQRYKMNNASSNTTKTNDVDLQMTMIKNFHELVPKQNARTKSSFNIVSSFRENIHFGGYWNRYAIINFTPNINIKPFDFISIYANQNLSCYIPISGIKEHFEFLCIQGASILAVDNSFKLLFNQDKIIPSIIGFALKNVIMSVLMSSLNNNSENKLYSFRSYYYSMSIQF